MKPDWKSGRFETAALALAGLMHCVLLLWAGDGSADLIVAAAGWAMALLVSSALGTEGGGTTPGAVAAGLLMGGLGILQCARMSGTDLWFLKLLAPLLLAGVLLTGHGWRGAMRRWRMGAIILIMAAPEKSLPFVDYRGALTVVHAGLAGFLLHCMGMEVAVHGNVLVTLAGAVKVEEACSGMALMLLLLKLALMLCIALRLGARRSIWTCLGALIAGYCTGTLRVCLLTALVGQRAWFQALHGPVGMNFFPLIGFLLFGPFLWQAEDPLGGLLRQARRGWRDAAPVAAGIWQLAVMEAAFGICIAAGPLSMPAERGLPLADSCAVQGLALSRAERVVVPDELLTRRFNGLQQARLWRIEKGGTTWKVLGCAVTNAQLGPEEMVAEPAVARFVEGEMGCDLSRVGALGLDAGNRGFFTTAEFNAAQRAALLKVETWKQWLRNGRPLKDGRYSLFLAGPEN